MPMRVYRCPFCNWEQEKLILKKEDKPKECPKCGSKELMLVPAQFSFTIRGNHG